MTTRATSRRSWRALWWAVPSAIVVLVVLVFISRWVRDLPSLAEFFERYPGESELPDGAPVGFPAWLAWQHYLNAFFLVLIIRSGWQVRSGKRPIAYWTRRNRPPFRTKNPPKKIGLTLWMHLALDILWFVNGVVFIVLIFASGQWMRIVPTSWDVVPNALSVLVQYLSLEWPTENGWVNYNSLQLLSYFVIVFVASPIAILTGLRMSSFWPRDAVRLNKLYPIEWARALHFPTMLFFVLFVIVHVTLVLATGALRNLNHMYAATDGNGWWGLVIFAAGLAVMVGAWFAASPTIIRAIAARTGSVTR